MATEAIMQSTGFRMVTPLRRSERYSSDAVVSQIIFTPGGGIFSHWDE
jgi:hypothetical protein